MTIDIFAYNGERDLLDLHLNILRPYVDRFIAVQSPTTFTGQPKPIYELPPEVESYVNDEQYTEEEIKLAETSPNTQGASHWKHEFLQKERIKRALEGLDDNDRVFIGDVDEIWEEDALAIDIPTKLKLRVYTYYLDNRSNEEFWGTITARWGEIKGECLNHLRSGLTKTKDYFGWHFTSMGGYNELKRKLEASYTEESYLTEWVKQNLEGNVKLKRDFLGRDFEFRCETKDWPQYLKDNQDKYKHLLNGQTA